MRIRNSPQTFFAKKLRLFIVKVTGENTDIVKRNEQMMNSRDLAVAAEKQKRVMNLAPSFPLSIDKKEQKVKQDVEKQYAPKKKRIRTIWVKDWQSRREIFGHYDQLEGSKKL